MLSWRTTFIIFLAATAINAHAASVTVDTSCTGTPTVGASFSVNIPAPDINGVACVSLEAGITFLTLDFQTNDFGTEPDCVPGPFFGACSVSQIGEGPVSIQFSNGSIPQGTAFSIVTTEFPEGLTINATANAAIPEPGTGTLLGIPLAAALLFTASARRRRLRSVRDNVVSRAAA